MLAENDTDKISSRLSFDLKTSARSPGVSQLRARACSGAKLKGCRLSQAHNSTSSETRALGREAGEEGVSLTCHEAGAPTGRRSEGRLFASFPDSRSSPGRKLLQSHLSIDNDKQKGGCAFGMPSSFLRVANQRPFLSRTISRLAFWEGYLSLNCHAAWGCKTGVSLSALRGDFERYLCITAVSTADNHRSQPSIPLVLNRCPC